MNPQKLAAATFLFALIGLTAAAPVHGQQRTTKIEGYDLELHALESVPAGESAAIVGTNQVLGEFFRQVYATPTVDSASGLPIEGSRRGVHPKAHGCLEGEMVVNSDLLAKDIVGIFQPGARYPVFSRFSNGGPHSNNDDNMGDSRGFGLKVMGVNGEPLLRNLVGADREVTQEFNMNSSEPFFADSAMTYHRFMSAAFIRAKATDEAAKLHLLDLLKQGKMVTLARAAKAFSEISAVKEKNPLNITYFSITPYQHGDRTKAAKFALAPCERLPDFEAAVGEKHFLRRNLVSSISSRDACFRFLIQDYVDEKRTPIENPMISWKTSDSPFREVARVVFPAQQIVDDARCERSVMNPWNTLAEHRPIGGINRLRLGAYISSIKARKATNPRLHR